MNIIITFSKENGLNSRHDLEKGRKNPSHLDTKQVTASKQKAPKDRREFNLILASRGRRNKDPDGGDGAGRRGKENLMDFLELERESFICTAALVDETSGLWVFELSGFSCCVAGATYSGRAFALYTSGEGMVAATCL